MPLYGRHNQPNSIVPTHLVADLDTAPALAIYFDGDSSVAHSVAVISNDITLTVGGVALTIPYATKSIGQIVERVNATDNPWYALALNEINSIASGSLTATPTDLTAENGFVIRTNSHTVEYSEDTRISLLPPYDTSRDLPWHARINIGSFSKTVNGMSYLFSIPEYENQQWSRFYEKPYVTMEGEVLNRLGTDRVRASRTPILWTNKNIILNLNNKALDSSLVEDVDTNNGIIYLSQDLSSNGRISASYTYREDSYVYKGVNLNPSLEHNPVITGQYTLFYLVPVSSTGAMQSNTTSVRHITSPTLQGCISSLPTYDYPILLLGAMQVRQAATVKDISLSDTRTRGGGVKEEVWDQAYLSSPGVRGNADSGWMDGEPYSGNAVLVINLPNSIKTVLGVEEIQNRATKTVAAGVKTLFEFKD